MTVVMTVQAWCLWHQLAWFDIHLSMKLFIVCMSVVTTIIPNPEGSAVILQRASKLILIEPER
jgi:hypothetical protein